MEWWHWTTVLDVMEKQKGHSAMNVQLWAQIQCRGGGKDPKNPQIWLFQQKTTEGREPTLHWDLQFAERKHLSPWYTWDSWSRWRKQSPNHEWKWELHHLGGVQIHRLVLLKTIFWPLLTLQRYPVLNFGCRNEITTLLRWVQTNGLVILPSCCISLTGTTSDDHRGRFSTDAVDAHAHLLETSLESTPLVDSSLRGKPHQKLTAWTQANRYSSGPSSSWLQHATLCPTFLSHHSRARVWTEMWGERRRKMGRELGKTLGEGREQKRNQVWATHAIGLALGTQFQILHWQFESQGRGSQGVDHVLVTLPTVLS